MKKQLNYTKITTFDIETIGDNFELDRIGLNSEDFAEIFLDYDSFFKFIIKKKIIHLYAFFSGGFDTLLLLDFFRYNKDFKLIDIIEINGLILYLKISYYGFQFAIQDAYFLVRCPLDTFAENMIGKRKLEIDRTRLQDYSEETRNDYVMNDCIILREAIIEFTNVLGFIDITISRIALLDFINRFCAHDLKYKYPKDFICDIQSFYYGGHVDVFKRYGENLNYYDINSCYGYAMQQCGTIFDFVCFVDKFADTETEKGLYNITIEDDLNIPVIPCRFKDKYYTKIYFLNTRKQLQCTSLDIELLEQLDVKYKIHNGYLFKYDADFFKSYIDYWYTQRQKSAKLNFIAKLMINSLYGKFGQKIKRLSTVISDKLEDSQYYDRELNLGRKEIEQINWFNKPEIASWITSGARFFHSLLLHKYQDNLYYCDTDSLIIDCEMDKDEIGKEIGKVKLEEKIKRGYFLGSKFYGLFGSGHNKIVLKGFERKDFTEQQFINAIQQNDFDFEYTKKSIQKFKRSLISFDQYIKFTEVKKEINEISLKRKLCDDLINTLPYFLTNKGILK